MLNYRFAFGEKYLIVPAPLEGGVSMYSDGFLVQTILDDRYDNRRTLCVVSLESTSSVEYGTEKIFLFSAYSREFLRFKVL